MAHRNTTLSDSPVSGSLTVKSPRAVNDFRDSRQAAEPSATWEPIEIQWATTGSSQAASFPLIRARASTASIIGLSLAVNLVGSVGSLGWTAPRHHAFRNEFEIASQSVEVPMRILRPASWTEKSGNAVEGTEDGAAVAVDCLAGPEAIQAALTAATTRVVAKASSLENRRSIRGSLTCDSSIDLAPPSVKRCS